MKLAVAGTGYVGCYIISTASRSDGCGYHRR